MNDEVCQVRNRFGKPCGRQIYSLDSCRFHVHLEFEDFPKDEEFEKEFWIELERMEKYEDTRELDFNNFIFPNYMNFKGYIFKKPIFFNNAKFNKGVDFTGVQFSRNANFSQVQFNDEADFKEAQFIDHAVFSNAQFNNKTSFKDAEFKKLADFANTRFKELVIFTGARFDNRVSFSEAHFGNKAIFYLAYFNFVVDFIKSKFNNKVCFLNTQFNNEAIFLETRFNNEANFSKAQFNLTNFRFSEFLCGINFINTIFPSNKDVIFFDNVKFHKAKNVRFQNIDLTNVLFSNTDITEVEFLDVKWGRKNGRLAVLDEFHLERETSKTDGYMKLFTPTYDSVAQLYRRLRKNYEHNYRFAEAGDFFIGEMEMLRNDVNSNINNEKILNIVLWFKRNFSFLGLYKHLSLYGESYIRPIIWTFVVIVSYPMLMHSLFNASLPQLDYFLYDNLRTSTATFFQMSNTYIGERIIGFLILGLLFIALKRKFERKK